MSSGPHKKVSKDGHEYHVSKNANATVAPTNEHSVFHATKTDGLSLDQVDFVTIIHYEYARLGHLPTAEFLFDEYGYSKTELEVFFSDKSCVASLEERGLTLNPKQLAPVGIEVKLEAAKVSKHTPKLTPLQLVVANALLDLSDTRSDQKKIKDMGVSTGKYQMWLRDPAFSGYLRDRAESMLPDNHHEVVLALLDKAKQGDMKAVTTYLEMTGRFVPQNNSNSNTPDLSGLIVRIIEIIIDEVDDAETASRISAKLKGLVTGAQVAGILDAPSFSDQTPFTKPTIAKAREVTPEVQELMSRGVGYDN